MYHIKQRVTVKRSFLVEYVKSITIKFKSYTLLLVIITFLNSSKIYYYERKIITIKIMIEKIYTELTRNWEI